jgi:hypothetical protein
MTTPQETRDQKRYQAGNKKFCGASNWPGIGRMRNQSGAANQYQPTTK